MKNKVKKIFNNKIFTFILGGIVFSSISVMAATYFESNAVTYDNTESGLTSTNVQGAIDELYNECISEPSGPSAINTITQLAASNLYELYRDDHGNIRYYGANPNNYVSFNYELWRIIGVVDGKVKIIRSESIGDKIWASNNINNWDNSDLKSYLNGDYYNQIDNTYKNMIANTTFYLGGPSYSDKSSTARDYYNAERSNQVYNGNPITTKQYIGLMYASDYGYAAGSSCSSTPLYDEYTNCKNNNYLLPTNDEYYSITQTPYSDQQSAIAVISNWSGSVLYPSGYISFPEPTYPVLYLTSRTQITGGSGTQSSPFTLQ